MPSESLRSWRYPCLILLSLVIVISGAVPALANLSRTFSPEGIKPYQLTNLTVADEHTLGQTIDAALRQDGLTLYRDHPPATDYIEQVGQRLVEASGSPILFTFQVVEDETPNAFATMGGFVYIHTGLLRAIQNEAELAGVLAHEMAHIQQRDGLNQLWLQLTTFQLAGFEPGGQQQLILWGGNIRSLTNSHEDEFTADAIAFDWLGRAGYAQVGMLTLLDRLRSHETNPPAPNLISTHPDPQRRLARLQQLWDTAAVDHAIDGQDEAVYRRRLRPVLESTRSSQGESSRRAGKELP